MKYCPNCGKEVQEDANFCSYCGQKIGSRSMPQHSSLPNTIYFSYTTFYGDITEFNFKIEKTFFEKFRNDFRTRIAEYNADPKVINDIRLYALDRGNYMEYRFLEHKMFNKRNKGKIVLECFKELLAENNYRIRQTGNSTDDLTKSTTNECIAERR